MLRIALDRDDAETDEDAMNAVFDAPDWADEANLTTIAELQQTDTGAPAAVHVMGKIVHKKFGSKEMSGGRTCQCCAFVLRDTTGDLRVTDFYDVATRLNTLFERNQSVELFTRSLVENPAHFRKERMPSRDCKLQVILDKSDAMSCLVRSQDDVAVEDAAPPASTTTGSKKFNKYEALLEIARLYEEKFDRPLSSVLLNVDGRIGTGDDPTAFFYSDGLWLTGKSQFSKLLGLLGSNHHETENYKLLYEHLVAYPSGHPLAIDWMSHMTEVEWVKKQNELADAEYPFADGVMNLVTGERRPFRPEDYLNRKDTRKMPSQEAWESEIAESWQYRHVSQQFEKVLPCKGLREEFLWWVGYTLMTPKKTLVKEHFNAYGRKDNCKTGMGKLITFGFGEVWVRDVDMRKMQTTSHADPERARGGLVDCKGIRLAIAEEGSKKVGGKGLREMDSNLLKTIAGASKIVARKLNKEDIAGFESSFLILFLTNPPVKVESEEDGENDRERDLVRRFEFPAWFAKPGEYAAYQEAVRKDPNAYPDRDQAHVHMRDAEQMAMIMNNPDEVQDLYFSFCVMKYVTKQYERFTQLLEMTDKWLKSFPTPAAQMQHWQALEEALKNQEPPPSPPISPANQWKMLTEPQREHAQNVLKEQRERRQERSDVEGEEAVDTVVVLGGYNIYDFYKRSHGEVTTYEEFVALISPLSTDRPTKYRWLPPTAAGCSDDLTLSDLLPKLFVITGDTGDWMFMKDMLTLVRDNPITNRRHAHVQANAIKILFNAKTGPKRPLVFETIYAFDPMDRGDQRRKVQKMGYRGLRLSGEAAGLFLEDQSKYNDIEPILRQTGDSPDESDEPDDSDSDDSDPEDDIVDSLGRELIHKRCRDAVLFPRGTDESSFDLDIIRGFSSFVARQLELRPLRFVASDTISLTRVAELVYKSAT